MAKRAKGQTAGARPEAAAGPEVESYRHEEAKRKNIPTAENQKLVADEDQEIKKLRWPRNPDLDPQLVWRGKDVEPDPLEVDVPPIYIQEKIHPRAIIDDLRRQTHERRNGDAAQFDFFRDFNGLPEGWQEDATASYYHDEGNGQNRMILGDSLLVMASLAEREGLRGQVQCIYMDPPYGIRFNSNWQPSTKSRDVKDGRQESVSREPEVVRAFRDTWKDGVNTYISYLRDRLVAARDLLTEYGSIFLQIGDENVHLARSVLDETFGAKNFVSLISISKTAGAAAAHLPSIIDYLIWYAKDIDNLSFSRLYELKFYGAESAKKYNRVQQDDLTRRHTTADEREDPSSLPHGSRIYRQDNLTSQSVGREKGEGAASWFPVEIDGRTIRPNERVRWKTNEAGMGHLIRAGRLELTGNSTRMFVS